MADVRGKFTVQEVTSFVAAPSGPRITLRAVYTGNPEDNSYSKATPFGEIIMCVTNPEAVERLALGKTFYVDFTEA